MLGPYKSIALHSDVGLYLSKGPTSDQRNCLKNFLNEAKYHAISKDKYKDMGRGVYAVTACEHVMTIFVRKNQEGKEHWRFHCLEIFNDDVCSS